jgi:DNA mismatch endonuclease, patch repair protein
MAAIRSRGNKDTELKLAAMLRAGGITGWRRHQQLPGRPDFVFRRERLAIFVDGCFWHGCPWHCRLPESNRAYWENKIATNALRDRAATAGLKADGWRVIPIWGHSLRSKEAVMLRLTSQLMAASKRCKSVPASHERK